MKKSYKITVFVLPCVLALAWTAVAHSNPEEDVPEVADLGAVIDQRVQEIRARVGMSALLEQPGPGEHDVIQDLLDAGQIVEATLEEVEAALAAAKATPEREDDLKAMKLAHQGSYRFFLEDGLPAKN